MTLPPDVLLLDGVNHPPSRPAPERRAIRRGRRATQWPAEPPPGLSELRRWFIALGEGRAKFRSISRFRFSSQQASNLAYALIASGVLDAAVACGVEIMSKIPMGATTKDQAFGKPINKRYWQHHEFTTQFEGSERIAEQWGITRGECDEFGTLSQDRAAQAWAEDRYATQVLPIDAPDVDEEAEPTGTTHRVERDEGMRETTLEALAALKPTGRPDGVHTAGTSSQICDGAGALLMMTREKADALGLAPKATVVDVCLVGSDPVLMLTGPIPATQKLLADNKLS